MVYSNVSGSMMKEPFQDMKKDKQEHVSSGYRQQQQQQQQQQQRQHHHQQSRKDEKYGAWGPIFKNKENFINMHIC